MFRNIVKNQYIGKSKLSFTYRDYLCDEESTIDALGYPLVIPGGHKNLPDYFIPGYFDIKQNSFKVVCLDNRSRENLYITGIPLGVDSIDPWRLCKTIWSSYYEDEHRGYLFQILNSNEPLILSL